MRTETINVYKFSELSEEAQNHAIEKYQQTQMEYEFFDEFALDDFEQIAKILGIEFRTRTVPLVGGGTREKPCIYYSGFCSQGDGASFEGYWSYKAGMIKAIKAYAPQDTELHAIAKNLQYNAKRFFYNAHCTITQSGRYMHENSMQLNNALFYTPRGDENYLPDDTEEELLDCFRSLAQWLYRKLEAEYEHQTSAEYARECLEENDYEFLENGDLYV